MTNSPYLKSMTGFASSILESSFGTFKIDIQSVNKRFLEINFNYPKQFNSYEIEFRKIVKKFVYRGYVTISFFCEKSEKLNFVKAVPNKALAKSVYQAWQDIAEELQVDKSFDLSILSKEKDIIYFVSDSQNEIEIQKLILTLLEQTLEKFSIIRLKEGLAIANDVSERISLILNSLIEIEAILPEVMINLIERLKNKIEAISTDLDKNDERVLREITVLADKADVSEELLRAKLHINGLLDVINRNNDILYQGKGKELDFIIQEIFREINTLGSKSSNFDISKRIVFLKNELEKIREQIQNIE